MKKNYLVSIYSKNKFSSEPIFSGRLNGVTEELLTGYKLAVKEIYSQDPEIIEL